MTLSPLRIGTAGWNVPARYKAELPRGGSELERYALALNAVEVNSSFYRPHQRTTYERWAQATPAGFRFSVKMPRTITHFARLNNCSAMLDRFVAEVMGLGEKLGVLLVQLAPKLAFDEAVVDRFFRDVQACIEVPVALEPAMRWFSPGMEEWLAERRIARVAANPAPVEGASIPGGGTGSSTTVCTARRGDITRATTAQRWRSLGCILIRAATAAQKPGASSITPHRAQHSATRSRSRRQALDAALSPLSVARGG
jgi:uncharacterized protein YecE (DUF72 family)